jgi:hypothetical protein
MKSDKISLLAAVDLSKDFAKPGGFPAGAVAVQNWENRNKSKEGTA